MRCPKCSQQGFHAYTTCTQCGFTGPAGQVEEFDHVAYLLGEIGAWSEIEVAARESLRTRYLGRREELEIILGLRPPPLTPDQVHELQWEMFCLGILRQEVSHWVALGWVRPWPADRLQQGAQKRITVLQGRLKEVPPPPAFDSVDHRLKLLDYLQEMLELADRRGHFSSDASRAAAQVSLQARRLDLEIEAGLRPSPSAVVPVAPAAEPAPAVEVPSRPPKPRKPPREPITWDRIWQTLLSERTLNVLLFLGAFLMVASATTYIVYNWENLPPAVQLGFIVLFTLSFYGAGWFLRVRMKLRASGIAVTAIGSVLVPLDFYAVGVVGGVVPADQWPWVWLIASAVCLPVYTFTTLHIQARFFGYLVVTAAGSLLCASLWVAGIPPEWLLAALVALAFGLLALAYRLQALAGLSPWRILDAPFRFSALIGAAAVLPLGIGWWLASGVEGLDFNASLAAAWTLGAVLYLYAAIRGQSPWLGRVAATILPGAVILVLRLAFEPLGIEAPWYALAWASLVPLYLWAGYRWHRGAGAEPGAGEDGTSVLRAHSQTATGWGLGMVLLAAAWSVFDQWAAAATHALLALGIALAIYLWRHPRALPVVSLFAFSSVTFGMAAGHLELAELCLGWALLAALHVLAALRLQMVPEYAARLFACALTLSALALLPPLIFANEWLLTYVLGQWIALAAWLLWLDHGGQHQGLTGLLIRLGPLRGSALHWAIALPLPFFVSMVYTRFRTADAWLGLLLAVLAWVFLAVGQLRRITSTSLVFSRGPGSGLFPLLRHWYLPWYLVAYGCSLAAPALALYAYDQVLLAVAILLASALYFTSTLAFHASWWLVPAGLALPLGLLILLDSWAIPLPQQSAILAGVVAAYLLGGIGLERGRQGVRDFLVPLYAVAHLVALLGLVRGLAPAVDSLLSNLSWSDPARLWAACGHLVLALVYALFAWFHARERWAHLAAWLGVLAAGLIATVLSQGRGSAAFLAALLAAVYVLAERLLAAGRLQHRRPLVLHLGQLSAGRVWSLYRRPLLVAGWPVSAGAIGLALLRNLVMLDGERLPTAWAVAGLLAVTALYAASAWLYRRRLFVWLAGVLVVLPWTLLAVWGWFVWPAPPLTRYALSWTILACLQLGLGLALTFRASRSQSPDYGFPLRVIANILLPLALLWAVADPATSSLTWGLGLVFYAVSAVADHRRGISGWRVSRFLYPAAVTLPVWAIYLVNRAWPSALFETYGLLLLVLALPLLAGGRLLSRIEPSDGLPCTLGACGVAIVGTVLVARPPALLAGALLFDATLCVLSTWILRRPLWGYPAAALVPAALLVAVAQSQAIPPERRGWWLIGLGAVYLAFAWLLRRAGRRRADLQAYATPPLISAFAVIAVGLALSSFDRTGAFWGYLAAALLYAAGAFWLRQPLLLAPAAAMLAVPYGVGLVWLDVNPADYGLALFPGVAAALVLAHLLERWLGRPGAILPDWHPKSWRLGMLLDWWAAPLYAWGYVGAVVAIGLSLGLRSGQVYADSIRLACTLLLAAITFLHATLRFRSRAYLLLAGTLAQAAALSVIDAVGWLDHPSWAALAFLPVTLATATLALAMQLWGREGSPLRPARPGGEDWWRGWSRPFYLLLVLDLLAGQAAALFHPDPGAVVTLTHALLLALLATIWIQPILPFAAAVLGVLGTAQAMAWAGAELVTYPIGLALLALVYGLAGYGIGSAGRGDPRTRIWLRPLEWTALGLSIAALIGAVGIGFDVSELLVRTLLGRVLYFADYAPQVQMVMWVLALCGLLYLATAAVHRRLILGYGAMALLLAAWGLWWRFFMNVAGIHWYAVPAGLYLLGVGWLEWRQGRTTLSRWIDRVGMLVLLGTAWWQSLPGVMDSGWPYALLLGAESLLLVWWGSARRQKQFLYIGALSLVVNVITQSIEPLLSVNRWIVFGLAGLLLVGLAILVERKLEAIRSFSADLRVRMEGWE